MFLLFFFVLVFSRSDFDGEWHLKRNQEIGSCNDVLRLIGIGSFKRRIMLSLAVTEKITLDETSFHLVRNTRYSNTDQTFVIGNNERINDVVLGGITQVVHILNAHHIRVIATRDNNRGVYTSDRRLTDPNVISYSMNYTRSDGKKAACVRFYDKSQ